MQFIADTSHHIMSSLSQLTCTNSIHRQKVYQFAHNFNLSHALCQDVYYIILRVVILRVNKCHKKERRFWMNNFSLFLGWITVCDCDSITLYVGDLLYHVFGIFWYFATNCCFFIHINVLYKQFTFPFWQLQLDYFDSFNLLVSVAASYLSL